MIDVEVINAILSPTLSSSSQLWDAASKVVDSFCLLRVHGREVGRTSICPTSIEPVWNDKITVGFGDVQFSEDLQHRPFALEHLELEVYEVKNQDKHIKIFEARVSLSNQGSFRGYKLLRVNSNDIGKGENPLFDYAKIFVRLGRLQNQSSDHREGHVELCKLCPVSSLNYRHLFMDFAWSAQNFSYTSALPGPLCGELVMDKYDYVLWNTPLVTNGFGDRFTASITGSLIVTDLRIIFLPLIIRLPSYYATSCQSTIYLDEHSLQQSSDVVLWLQKFTIQLPLSALEEIKVTLYANNMMEGPSNTIPGTSSQHTNSQVLHCLFYDRNEYSFVVYQDPHQLHHFFSTSTVNPDFQDIGRIREAMSLGSVSPMDQNFSPENPGSVASRTSQNRPQSKSAADIARNDHQLHHELPGDDDDEEISERSGEDEALEDEMLQFGHRSQQDLYNCGLETAVLEPIVWCNRVCQYVAFEIRQDLVWLRWAKYLKRTMISQFAQFHDRMWMKKIRELFSFEADLKRMFVQDLNWRFSDLNASYHLCSTYPAAMVFPGALTEEEVIAAAAQRSSNRLPVLTYLHPITKAPLCRSSQPLAGLSGVSSNLEFDKKLLLSIRESCLPLSIANQNVLLPLRIVDARPKLNANANAMQGKGFENVAFIGGPTVCNLAFMDIENIHVMRSSIQKVREALFGVTEVMTDVEAFTTTSMSTASVNNVSNIASFDSSTASSSAVASSKWLVHLASVLRGAVTVADSLQLCYPVLVHCSDGWDRTSQLTCLAQLLLDPHYRTIDGFLELLIKEFGAFGHKFEDRSGRSAQSKEVSPIFLQVLDCAYQVLQQFPKAFEFTPVLLLVLVQAFQSGFFTCFRGNCEKDRIFMMKHAALLEDLVSDDFDYSTISIYIQTLRRCHNYGLLLTNPHYQAPAADLKKACYLRPRCAVSDMQLWKEGLFGYNYYMLSCYGGELLPNVSSVEGAAITQDFLDRSLRVLDLQLSLSTPAPVHCHDVHAAQLIELIKGAEYPCAAYHAAPHTYTTATLPSRFRRNSAEMIVDGLPRRRVSLLQQVYLARSGYQKMLLQTPGNASSQALARQEFVSAASALHHRMRCFFGRDPRHFHAVEDKIAAERREYAAQRIILWFRSLFNARLSLLLSRLVDLDFFETRPPGAALKYSASVKRRKFVAALHQCLFVLINWYLKQRWMRREYQQQLNRRFVSSLVAEIVSSAVDSATREQQMKLLTDRIHQKNQGEDVVFAAAVQQQLKKVPSHSNTTLSSRLLSSFGAGNRPASVDETTDDADDGGETHAKRSGQRLGAATASSPPRASTLSRMLNSIRGGAAK